MSTLIEAHAISVIRQDRTILKDVSVSVSAGDFITIIGPNGAGKSMLLKCLIGLKKTDQGTIERADGLRIGYVPQRILPDHTMPISVTRFLTLRKQVDPDVLERIVAETGIESIVRQPLSVLSGGELQRVLLARSLLDKPQLLVLDEPAQNLDVSGQLSFYKLLERIYQSWDLSVLMVSHDLHMVMASTKQVICLFHHICCSGTPQVVTKDPEFVSLFGNEMANMMAVYQHSHNHTHDEACDA